MRLLIVRLSALGDIITSMVVLQFIHQKFPEAQIDWLVDEKFQEVLKHHPHIHQIHTIALKAQKGNLLKLFREMRRVSKTMPIYDSIIDMQGLMKSALLSRLIGKNTVGFDRHSVKESLSALFYRHQTKISFNDHILNRNASLLKKAFGLNLSYDQLMQKSSYLFFEEEKVAFDDFLSSNLKNILVVLGGSWASKIYPKEKLVEALKVLKKHRLLLLWSDPSEYERAMWLQKKCQEAIVLPKLSLNDLKALITKVDLVLGNDTGPTHMAWALNKPSLTLLGCTSKTRIPENPKNRCLTSNTLVNPSKINKHDLSIGEIDPLEVAKHVEELLQV